MKIQDKIQIHFFATKAEKDWLKQYCDKSGRTITDVMREYIRQLMKEEYGNNKENLDG